MASSDSLKKLKDLRSKFLSEFARGGSDLTTFLDRLQALISDWRGEVPDLRSAFRPEEIERILAESVLNDRRDSIIHFVIDSGYENEPSAAALTTALHRAARQDRGHDIISGLFKVYRRSSVNYVDFFGSTHFHIACKYGCVDMVENLLEHGQVDHNLLERRTEDSPLHLALKNTKREVVESLLKHGADPNLANEKGLTPLHVIICRRFSDAESMEAFFKITDQVGRTPIQLDARDKMGNVWLHLALLYGNKKAVELLLRRGADPNLIDEQGSTPLHVICRESDSTWSIIDMKKLYDENTGDRCFNDDYDMAKMLFEISDELGQTVQVDARDDDGDTPLHLAVKIGNKKLVELLTSRGADLTAANAEGLTPVHLMYKKCTFNGTARTFFKIDKEVIQRIHRDALHADQCL
ncbi:tankyrase-1-like [Trichogramma pretiosum]|uniref:tankyrase-1-like n=1 Tax=Trichogramma pretiosum TaxID=7493 RepID=UPI0006C997F0|nr:tankyrase-1-like [Trichogramma pretiosum]